jgi:hypothetical protein
MSIGSTDRGRLLGRADEVGLLTSLLDGVEDAGGALVIRGEPGVGKTRLLSSRSTSASTHSAICVYPDASEKSTVTSHP